jgi:ribosomal subunit interface protein
MSVNIKWHNVNSSAALVTHIETKIAELTAKYFNRLTSADIIMGREGHHLFTAHVNFHVGHGVTVMADGSDPDAYAAFEEAADRIGRQLKRYKDRLRDHHKNLDLQSEKTTAQDYVLETSTLEVPQKDEPIIVAEMTTNIQSMSVSEAVMRLDLSQQNALLFKNAKHGGLNLVYRRQDGNIGWVDPQEGLLASAKDKAA